jgi:hypothetical protein
MNADLASSLGVPPEVLERAGPSVASTLEKLPADVHEAYKSLAPEHKKLIASKLSGSTKVLFMTINNREAFVKGSVAGMSVFDKMESGLEKNAARYNLDAAAVAGLSRVIDHFRRMTQDQRSAVASLLEAEARTL